MKKICIFHHIKHYSVVWLCACGLNVRLKVQKTHFYREGSQTLENVAQISSGVSIVGDTRAQLEAVLGSLSRAWTRQSPEVPAAPGPPVILFPSPRDVQCNAEENGEGGIPAQTVLSESGQNYDEQASNVKIPNQ